MKEIMIIPNSEYDNRYQAGADFSTFYPQSRNVYI